MDDPLVLVELSYIDKMSQLVELLSRLREMESNMTAFKEWERQKVKSEIYKLIDTLPNAKAQNGLHNVSKNLQ